MSLSLSTILPVSEALTAVVQAKNPFAALLYAFGQQSGGNIDIEEAQTRFSLDEHILKQAADILVAYGVCRKCGQVLNSPQMPKMDEMLLLKQTDYGFQGICNQFETAKGLFLSQSDVETLYDIYSNLRLPPDVIYLIIGMLNDHNRFSKSTFQKTAYELHDRGISTYDGAEGYLINKFDAIRVYRKILEVLGIKGRDPVASEKRYIDQWIEKNIGLELISLAYEKTVFNLKELRWPYMNKILETWVAAGYKTVNDIEVGESPEARKKTQGSQGSGNKNEGKIARLTAIYTKKRQDRDEKAAQLIESLMAKSSVFAENQRKISSVSQKLALASVTGGNISALQNESIALQRERDEILKTLNISPAMINPPPDCEKCQDYGYIGSVMCSCFKENLEKPT